MYYCVQTVESSLQHKVDMVSRLEQKTTQMAATIRDMEDGSVCLICHYMFAERAFSFAGPAEWNCLQTDLKMTTNTNSFKKKLKAHFYGQAFLAE